MLIMEKLESNTRREQNRPVTSANFHDSSQTTQFEDNLHKTKHETTQSMIQDILSNHF